MGEPSNHIFINAKQYLNLARYCHDDGNLDDVSIAAVSNYAFSVELMLKCLDTTTIPSLSVNNGVLSQAYTESNSWGHDLRKIFDNLPDEARAKLASKYKSVLGQEITLLLDKCKDYFVLSRYYHDPKSQISYDISGVRKLAEGIEFSLATWYA